MPPLLKDEHSTQAEILVIRIYNVYSVAAAYIWTMTSFVDPEIIFDFDLLLELVANFSLVESLETCAKPALFFNTFLPLAWLVLSNAIRFNRPKNLL